MEQSTKDKLTAVNNIAILMMLAIVIGWLIFKPDNGLSKDTVDKLTIAVDRVAVAADNMNKVAIKQQEWSTDLQRNMTLNGQKRDNDYDDLYGKYGYSDEGGNISLNDIYHRRVLAETDNHGSRDIRPSQNGVSQAGDVQKPTGESKG